MKRIIAYLFCAILMVIPSFAAEMPKLTVNISSTEPKREELITVTVFVDQKITYKSAALIITVDPDLFILESGEWDLTDAILSDFDEKEHVAAIAYKSEQTTEGALLTFTMRVKNEASLGKTAIVITPVFKNGDQTVICSPAEQEVTVSCTHTYGLWMNNESGHWKECACGDKTDMNAHTFREETQFAATPSTGSEKVFICTECGYRKTEPLQTSAPSVNPNPLAAVALPVIAVAIALILFFVWTAKRKGHDVTSGT